MLGRILLSSSSNSYLNFCLLHVICRLSEQARQQFDGHGQSKFEDLSLGSGRPSQLISRYGNLFSQARVDASDALDDLDDLNNVADLKGKLLFSVVVVSAFRFQPTLSLTYIRARVLPNAVERATHT